MNKMITKIVHLNIGEIIISNKPIVVSTVLGSCVSVCLFSKVAKAGGIVHYALPQTPAVHSPGDQFRYGDQAISAMVDGLTKLTGHSPASFSAKIVGGAYSYSGKQNIGLANFEIAQKMLDEFQIQVIGQKTGGDSGIKVLFHLQTGQLQIAPIEKSVARLRRNKSYGT
jgi:chemotaxis protein CheD